MLLQLLLVYFKSTSLIVNDMGGRHIEASGDIFMRVRVVSSRIKMIYGDEKRRDSTPCLMTIKLNRIIPTM